MNTERPEADGDEDEGITVTLSDDDNDDGGEGGAPASADDGDDERLAADQRDDDERRANETEDERRERRRKERKEKNERRKAYQVRDQLVIQSLQQQNEDLKRAVFEIQKQFSTQQASTIEGQMRTLQGQIQQANAERAKAIQDGDGQRAVQLEEWSRRAYAQYQQLDRMRRQPAQAPRQESVDPTIADHAKVFLSRHDWYDPSGSDELSKTVAALDNGVARDGYDPRTPDYWEELEARMRRRLPAHLFDGTDAPAKRRAPPVAGRPDAAAPKGRSVTIPREFREALEESGLWADPKKRDRAIKQYLQMQKENRA